MEQVLIAKDVAYLAKVGSGSITKNELDLLADGAIALLNESGGLIAADGTGASGNGFQIAVGTPAGMATKISDLIKIGGATLEHRAYAAGTPQISFLGNNGTAGSFGWTLADVLRGDYAEIRVFEDKPYRLHGSQFERLSYTAKTNSPALADVVTGLIANINDQSKVVDAVVEGANLGIKLTGKEIGQPFKVTPTLGSFLEFAAISTTQNASYGIGTPAELKRIEEEADAFTGRMGGRDAEFPQLVSLVDNAATYDMFTINVVDGSLSVAAETKTPTQVILAIPASATAGNNFTVVKARLEAML